MTLYSTMSPSAPSTLVTFLGKEISVPGHWSHGEAIERVREQIAKDIEEAEETLAALNALDRRDIGYVWIHPR
jgi:hypothetical protein